MTPNTTNNLGSAAPYGPEDDLVQLVSRLVAADGLLNDAELMAAPTAAGGRPADNRPPSTSAWAWVPGGGEPGTRFLGLLWVVVTAVGHAILAALQLGTVAVATALLGAIGWLTVDSCLGIPLASVSACCVGLLGAADVVDGAIRSFRRSLQRCPW